MAETATCPLCDHKTARCEYVLSVRVEHYECRTCGEFAIEETSKFSLRELDEKRYLISAIVREHSIRGSKLLLVDGDIVPTLDHFESVQITELLSTHFPKEISSQLDRALVNLRRLSDGLGYPVEIDLGMDRSLFFARDKTEADFVVTALEQDGLLTAKQSSITQHDLVLSPAGWNRIAEIERGADGLSSKSAFVAMWYGNEEDAIEGENSRSFCTRAYDSGFRVGVEQAGYEPRRIDFKEFNDDIMDEIVVEIRQSRFVVADFTGHRPGVYYEAGFARGMEIPVIFTCHESHLNAAHFDTNHMNHIAWKSSEDLARRLEKRIVATVGPGPLKRAEHGREQG
ncbi:MAG: hypothetical protein IH986_12575 [Planctomycetes bacterium]|nr:hypothetical protein [Planctomycetota bacterium]